MKLKCSTCGRIYPEQFQTNTCRICGGLLENASMLPTLPYFNYKRSEAWYEWRNKVFSAPPRFLTEAAWLKACATFNGCALCGTETIEEKLLVIPPYLKGKLYTYNVIPACSYCAKTIRFRQRLNPLKPFYKVVSKDRLEKIFTYLESQLYDEPLETFDFEHDSIEIIVKVTEDTSNTNFDGIYARRLFKKPQLHIVKDVRYEIPEMESHDGITWRLL